MDDNGGSFESLSTIQPKIRRLDPFWATRLWQRLIKEALMNVRVCRQRHFLKNYDDVFNGEDLVDMVLKFLKECTSELDVERINRTNALKVCQVLMNKKLFESVVPKGNQKFEDGSHRLYRFIQDEATQDNTSKEIVDAKENYSLKPVISLQEEKENLFSPPSRRTSCSFTPDLLRGSTRRRSLRIKTPLLRVRDTKPSPVRFAKRSSRDSDQEAFLAKRDHSLALLLQLVDVPVLESILSVPHDLPALAEAPSPFVLENDFTPRKARLLAQVDLRGPVAEVPWVQAASRCLGGVHPPGLAGLWSVQASKVLCYRAVVERFSCCAESLIPGEYFAVCIPIVRMLKEEQRAQALSALQLLMFHLPWKRRQQLRHLLHFLHLVVEDIFVCVDRKVTNYEAVLRDFLTVVFKHPLVSQETQKILFDYLLLKSNVVFETASCLQKIETTDLRFCEPQAEDNQEAFTKKSLLDLASFVVDSTQIKLAEKKVFLKKLKKHHPVAHQACNFED